MRDPRDALVSKYFSVAFSRSLPPASTAADGGVREGLLRLKDDPLLTVYRYEDVVLDKRPWITDIAKRLNLALPQPLLESILTAVDVDPSEERPTAFVRRVVPGDHLEKLAPGTIEELNSRFGDFLHAFGYILIQVLVLIFPLTPPLYRGGHRWIAGRETLAQTNARDDHYAITA